MRAIEQFLWERGRVDDAPSIEVDDGEEAPAELWVSADDDADAAADAAPGVESRPKAGDQAGQ